jgi:hypothetical protein
MPLVWLVVCLQTGLWSSSIPDLVAIGVVMYTAIIIGCTVMGTLELHASGKLKIHIPDSITDNFVIHAYKSLHDKTCFKVVFTNKVGPYDTIPHKYGIKLKNRDDVFTFTLPVGETFPWRVAKHASFVYDITADVVCVGSEQYREVIKLFETAEEITGDQAWLMCVDFVDLC